MTVACGRCVGCRLERSRQWALRCVHEAQLHTDNAFITLTYSDSNLPYGGTLVKKHFQDFMKRVRKKYPAKHFGKINYFHCGEYGERTRRPHYHALLFGLRFSDQLVHQRAAAGHVVYTSEVLSNLWGLGFCTIGEVTFESAAYTARYIMKKINGDDAEAHYTTIEPDTGEVIHLQPEYITMSLKPAIAKDWYEAFSTDVYPDDFVVARGKKMKPPKYYDKQLEKNDPQAHKEIKADRVRYAATQKENSTPERLAVREAVKLSQIASLKRTLD